MKVFSEKDKRGTSKNMVHDDVFANVFNRVVDVKGRHPRFHAFLTRQAICAHRIAAASPILWLLAGLCWPVL